MSLLCSLWRKHMRTGWWTIQASEISPPSFLCPSYPSLCALLAWPCSPLSTHRISNRLKWILQQDCFWNLCRKHCTWQLAPHNRLSSSHTISSSSQRSHTAYTDCITSFSWRFLFLVACSVCQNQRRNRCYLDESLAAQGIWGRGRSKARRIRRPRWYHR